MSKNKYIPRLREKYKNEIAGKLVSDLGLKNIMEVPKILKISINMGLGDAKENKNSLKQAVEELSHIAGQKAVITYSKKAISNFKLRVGDPVGVKVTLRGNIMYEFLDRFISITSPRIRDFRGLSSTGFDNFGNYNFGITEQIVFPEIDYDKVNTLRGMNITIVTTAPSSNQAHTLLKSFGFPINEIKENIKREVSIKDVVSEKESSVEEEAPIEESFSKEIPPKETPEVEDSVEDSPVEKENEEEITIDESSSDEMPSDIDKNK